MGDGAGEDRSSPWWDRLLLATDRLVFESPTLLLVAAAAGISILKDGLGTVPNLPLWVSMAKAFPARPRGFPTKGNYLFGSPIGPMIGHIFRATNAHAYIALHVLALVAALTILVIGLRRQGSRLAVGVGLTALFSSALSNILPSWLGIEDPFIFGFASLVILFDSPLLVAIAGAGLALSNPAIGAITVATRVAFRSHGRSNEIFRCVLLIAAFLAGLGITIAYEVHVGARFGGEITFLRIEGPKHVLREWLQEPFAWLFTLFGAWWFFLGAVGRLLFNGRTGYKMLVLASVVGLLTVFTVDQTRIFALGIWPALLWLSVRAVSRVPSVLLRKATVITFLVAVVLPRLWIEEGMPVISAWAHVL